MDTNRILENSRGAPATAAPAPHPLFLCHGGGRHAPKNGRPPRPHPSATPSTPLFRPPASRPSSSSCLARSMGSSRCLFTRLHSRRPGVAWRTRLLCPGVAGLYDACGGAFNLRPGDAFVARQSSVPPRGAAALHLRPQPPATASSSPPSFPVGRRWLQSPSHVCILLAI
jgi:hypothetical protein